MYYVCIGEAILLHVAIIHSLLRVGILAAATIKVLISFSLNVDNVIHKLSFHTAGVISLHSCLCSNKWISQFSADMADVVPLRGDGWTNHVVIPPRQCKGRSLSLRG